MPAAGMTACTSTYAEAEGPAEAGVSAEAAASDALLGPDGASDASDRMDSGASCRGAFGSPVVLPYQVDRGPLKSARGTANGVYLVSFGTSSGDEMATATVKGGILQATAANALGPINGPFDDTAPTAPKDLSFVVFASTRPLSGADASDDVSSLWSATLVGGLIQSPTLLSAKIGPVGSGAPANPYLAGSRVYFDSNAQLYVGTLTSPGTLGNVSALAMGPSAGAALHPVVTADELELFLQTGLGVSIASRASTSSSFQPINTVLGQKGDYPTWISDDACHLYVIRTGIIDSELRIYDRAP
jgi:hypothetical protein